MYVFISGLTPIFLIYVSTLKPVYYTVLFTVALKPRFFFFSSFSLFSPSRTLITCMYVDCLILSYRSLGLCPPHFLFSVLHIR